MAAVLKWDKEVIIRFVVVMGLLALAAVEILIKFLCQNMADYLAFIKKNVKYLLRDIEDDFLGPRILDILAFLGNL